MLTRCDKTYKEIDESQINIVKIEPMESKQNFNLQNIDLSFVEVPSLEGYHSNTATKPKCRRRNCKKSQSLTLPKHGHPMDSMLILKDRFRPIRPKPLRLSVSKHKYDLPTLSSNLVIVHNTVPIKKKFRYIIPSDISNKIKNSIESNSSNSVNNINGDNSNTVNIQLETKENKIETQDSNTVTDSYCNINGNSNTNINSNNSKNISYSNCNKDLHSIKATSHPNKNSIELFFESMAQTVLNLPNEVQANIKMQICKIVTNAEIRYCESQMKIKTEN